MVNKADNDALETQFESQFQKPGDLVERDDDTGAMSIESLCMNCHEQGFVLSTHFASFVRC
jgi:zinc finger protein